MDWSKTEPIHIGGTSGSAFLQEEVETHYALSLSKSIALCRIIQSLRSKNFIVTLLSRRFFNATANAFKVKNFQFYHGAKTSNEELGHVTR